MEITHHPFDVPLAALGEGVVGRSSMAMSRLTACHVDIVLSGHLHLRHIGSSATRYKAFGRPILLVQAGTATSTRRRGELNSCNLLRIESDSIGVDWLIWNGVSRTFEKASTELVRRGGEC